MTEEEGSEADDAKSDISDDIEELDRAMARWRPEDETIADRLYALKDMVSPSTRQKLSQTWSKTYSWGYWGGRLLGNGAWIITTSALLVGLPLALSIENETMMVQQEKEMLAQQQGAQQVGHRDKHCDRDTNVRAADDGRTRSRDFRFDSQTAWILTLLAHE